MPRSSDRSIPRDGEDYAVAVVGAGPAGSVAAAALARAGLRVALIDRGPRPSTDLGECLPGSVRPLLERAGLWPEFRQSGHLPSFGTRSAWGSPALTVRDFLFSPFGCEWHIDRVRFDRMLVGAAVASGARHLAPRALRAVERDLGRDWRLTLSEGGGATRIRASFVIDATGRSSAFARRVGVRRLCADRLVAVAGQPVVTAESPALESVLLVEAVPDGWWYSAPLPGGTLVAVYVTDAGAIARRQLNSPDGWWTKLGASVHTRRRVERHGRRSSGSPTTVPADTSRLERVAGPGWLAAGDAAFACDPLCSRGLMAAVAGGFEAARTASAWLAGDEDAVDVYAQGIARHYAAYLLNRKSYYALERRWPDAPFWRRRRSNVSLHRRRQLIAEAMPEAAPSIR